MWVSALGKSLTPRNMYITLSYSVLFIELVDVKTSELLWDVSFAGNQNKVWVTTELKACIVMKFGI